MLRNAAQAVQFAFIIEAYPQGGRPAIVHAMKQAGITDAHANAGINYDGMTPTQIRMECTKVRETVRTSLKPHEAAAIMARHSINPLDRHRAIKELTAHFRAIVMAQVHHFTLAERIIERHYVETSQRNEEHSLRHLAERFRVNRSAIQKAADTYKTHALILEQTALDNLRALFESAHAESEACN